MHRSSNEKRYLPRALLNGEAPSGGSLFEVAGSCALDITFKPDLNASQAIKAVIKKPVAQPGPQSI